MPTLSPTAASAADADRAALHTTASGVPNEHVSRLRQWFCSCASTTITPTAERINWYGKQTNCCIGSTERPQRAPARASTLMTVDDGNCSCFFDELGRCNGLSCSHDVSNWSSCTRMLRSRRDIENVDKQLVQLIVLVSMLPMMAGILKIVRCCAQSVGEMRPMAATALPALDWFSGRPACPRRPHCPRCPTHNTHTHNHTIAATAAVSAPGGAAGTQRSRGKPIAEGEHRRRRTGARSCASRRPPSPPLVDAAATRDEQFGEPL